VLIAVHVVAALVLLVLASDAFTNAVEWLGSLLGLTRNAMGSVVAAIGSSMPETMVAFIALIVLRDPASQAVGIGAVIGAPFMLATAVFGLIGVTAIVRRRFRGDTLDASLPATAFGLGLFALTFAVAIGASFAPTAALRSVAVVIVLLAYASFLWYQLRRRGSQSGEEPLPLRFAPRAKTPALGLVITQFAVAIVVTIGASRWFVASVADAASATHLSPLLVSLVLSPIATEIPEAANVTIWMRRGLDELAMGNVLGAMLFQTSIASALAILASPWRLDHDAYLAAILAGVAVLAVLLWSSIRRRVSAAALAACGLLYGVYVAAVFIK